MRGKNLSVGRFFVNQNRRVEVKKDQYLHFRVPANVEQRIFTLARLTGLSKSEFIRQAIQNEIERLELELNQDRSAEGSTEGHIRKGIS